MARLVLIALLTTVWLAPTNGVAKSTSDDKKQAAAIYERSAEAYNAGRFDEAVKLLQTAYLLDPNPVLLYNLARAQEGAGDWVGAVQSYRKYLDESEDIDDRAFVEQKVATLQAQIDRQRELETELERARADAQPKNEPPPEPAPEPTAIEPPPALAPPAPTPTAPPVEEPPALTNTALTTTVEPDESSVVPWVVAGTGLAAIAGGVVVGLMSNSRRNEGLGESMQVRSKDLQDQANQLAVTADVLFIAGGVVAVGGLIWAAVE